MLPDIRRLLEDHKITDIDMKFERYSGSSEWANYKFAMFLVDNEHCYQFFTKRRTAMSMFACAEICVRKGNYENAIEYYKLYCEMGNPDRDGYSEIAWCYGKMYDMDKYFKYMDLGAMSGECFACSILGSQYESCDLYKSRHYYKLHSRLKNDLERVERKLLAQFATQLNKQDYLLAYELMQKYNTPGGESLRILINNEYFDALGQTLGPWGLIKDLSNIVVSYLI